MLSTGGVSGGSGKLFKVGGHVFNDKKMKFCEKNSVKYCFILIKKKSCKQEKTK
jgi:hypothetical protein